jgi:D-alanyl-D-alanine carboxypeptidase (penicillin-binding protein 5/6)
VGVSLGVPSLEVSLPIAAHSAILIDASTGTVLYSQNADEALPMASTTKIMTALVVLDRYDDSDLDDIVVVSEKASRIDGSRVYLDIGERQTVRDLLYAMLLESANDASIALAEHVSGSVEQFADLMNEYASMLRAKSTHFENPHGLPSDNHYTTARDLALISAYAMKHPTLRSIVATKTHRIPWPAKNTFKDMYNHNRLLFTRDDITGIKPGFTSQSGHCLVISAQRDGIELIAVLLRAEQAKMWNEGERLIDIGLSTYQSWPGPATGQVAGIKRFPNGTVVMARVAHGNDVLLPKEADTEGLRSHVVWNEVRKVDHGQRAAKLIYEWDGQVIAEFDLLADVVTRPKNSNKFAASLRSYALPVLPVTVALILLQAIRRRKSGSRLRPSRRHARLILNLPATSDATSRPRPVYSRRPRRRRRRYPSSRYRS